MAPLGPSSIARSSKSSATSAFLPSATRSRREIASGLSGVLFVAGEEHGDVGVLQRSRGLHRPQRGDDHRDPALVVARARARAPCRPRASSAGTANPARTPYRDAPISSSRLPVRLPAWRATRWPARPAAPMSIHWVVKPSCSELGRDHVADGFDAGLVHGAAVLVDPALEHRDGALLLGIDGLDHRLLLPAERGGSGAGEDERKRRTRAGVVRSWTDQPSDEPTRSELQARLPRCRQRPRTQPVTLNLFQGPFARRAPFASAMDAETSSA